MAQFPWGVVLLLPAAWLLFLNRGRRLAAAAGLSRRNLLWYIFFVLLASFFNLRLGKLYLNLGGLLLLALAGRMFWQAESRVRWNFTFAALSVGAFVFAFEIGVFWWLVKLPFATAWLLPLGAFALALLFGRGLRASWGGVICGLVVAEAAAGYTLSGGVYFEIGNFAVLNDLLLALGALTACDLLLRRQPKSTRRLMVKKNSV